MDNVHAHAVLGYAETLGRLVIERGHPRLVPRRSMPRVGVFDRCGGGDVACETERGDALFAALGYADVTSVGSTRHVEAGNRKCPSVAVWDVARQLCNWKRAGFGSDVFCPAGARVALGQS